MHAAERPCAMGTRPLHNCQAVDLTGAGEGALVDNAHGLHSVAEVGAVEEERDQEEAVHAGGKQSRLGIFLALRPPGATRDGLYLGRVPVVEHFDLHTCLSGRLQGRRLVQSLACGVLELQGDNAAARSAMLARPELGQPCQLEIAGMAMLVEMHMAGCRAAKPGP